MKRFTVVAGILSISILALWVVLQMSSASSTKAKAYNPEVKANNTKGEVSKADPSGELTVPVTGADVMVAPVYDANGALLSDPSGIVSNATVANMTVAPVFDAHGNLLSDPAGTVSNVRTSGL